jgi:hypothetical protein
MLQCDGCSFVIEPEWTHCPSCGAVHAPSISSHGQSFWPDAFTGAPLRLGLYVASCPEFMLVFNRYLLSIQTDPTQLVHFREGLLKEAARLLWNRSKGIFTAAFWVSLSLCGDRFFSEKATRFGWSTEQRDNLLVSWYAIMAPAFLPSRENRRLDISVIRNWLAAYTQLHNTSNVPFDACKLCRSQCFYGYEAAMYARFTENISSDLNASLNRKDVNESESAGWFARLSTERMIGQHNTDLAYCLMLQLVAANEKLQQRVSVQSVRQFLEGWHAEEDALFNGVTE